MSQSPIGIIYGGKAHKVFRRVCGEEESEATRNYERYTRTYYEYRDHLVGYSPIAGARYRGFRRINLGDFEEWLKNENCPPPPPPPPVPIESHSRASSRLKSGSHARSMTMTPPRGVMEPVYTASASQSSAWNKAKPWLLVGGFVTVTLLGSFLAAGSGGVAGRIVGGALALSPVK